MNVIINGLDLSDKGITVADVYVSEASPKLIQTDIPGRDGLLDQSKAVSGFINYQNRQMTIVGYAQESYEDYLKRYSWLLNEINGQTAEIINTSDADFIWKGLPTVTYTKVNSIYSEITINCEVHPYKLKKQDTIVEKTVSEDNTAVICANLARPVVPMIETSKAMQISFENKIFNVQAGTHILDILFIAGENTLTVTGNGNIKITYREGSL